MEQKLIRVPFDIELAKKITNGKVDGKIVTRDGDSVRILCWDKKDKTCPIAALVDDGTEEYFKSYTNEGVWSTDRACTLTRFNLMLEIPEYMTFKDGDVLMLRSQFEFVYVKNSTNGKYGSYVGIALDDYRLFFDSKITSECDEDIAEYRHATEEEKQKLIDALKASEEPKAKEYLKRFFGIEQKQEYEFKPFDRVLVRAGNDDCWHADIFSHKNKDRGRYYCTGYEWRQCIPYNEQTSHLLGTTDNWEE